MELGERVDEEDLASCEWSACEWSDDEPRADTVKVSLAMTALGGEGFMATEIEPRIRCTSG
jgi:hypothetical protein